MVTSAVGVERTDEERGKKRTSSEAERRQGRRSGARVADPLGLVGIALIGAIWYLVTAAGWVRPIHLPSPGQVFSFIGDNFFASQLIEAQSLGTGGIWTSLLFSASAVWVSVVLACALAIPLGLASAKLSGVRMISDPLLLTIGTIPILIVTPFFLVWFGTSRWGQIILLVLYCMPVVYVYAQRAVSNLNPLHAASALVMGASSARLLRDVYLPGTLPEVLGGVRIALAGSWGLAAIAELMGSGSGIGKLIATMSATSNVVAIYAVILCLAIVASVTDLAVVALVRWANRWEARST